MGWNINITAKNVGDLKQLANILSELVENATGQRANVRLHDKTKLLKKREQESLDINRKLLK